MDNRHHIDLRGFRPASSVLDIGGGGEGMIARRLGDGVVSIDKRRDELTESPDIGLKIVMDACELGFLDASFDHITCFFALMYMGEDEIERCLLEARRVLKPGGRLWIWDAEIPPQAMITAEEERAFIVSLDVLVADDCRITVDYGVGWTREQTADSIVRAGERSGFHTVLCSENTGVFQLIFLKP